MKGFIIKKGENGELAIPVCHIKTILLTKIGAKWIVDILFFSNNNENASSEFDAEADAREWYEYCLKQVAKWQNSERSL